MAPGRKALVFLLFFSSLALTFGQASSAASALRDGIDQFRTGQYDKAILLLRGITLDPTAEAQKPQAYLLIAKSYLALGKLDDADHNLEFYIANYPKAPDYPEALYQKGRLLLMQEDYESAIQQLQTLLSAFPQSTFASSAWFWVGESLYGLGRLDDAQKVYQKVLTDYPTSVKVEAAQYKISLIQLRKKEDELSLLLKWSHEDFLKTVEEYQRRERTYEQAIDSYQKRLSGLDLAGDQKTIAALQNELAQKTDEANKLAAQLNAASATGAAAGGAGATAGAAGQPVAAVSSDQAAQLARLQRMLAIKQQALALKETYLTWLEINQGGTP